MKAFNKRLIMSCILSVFLHAFIIFLLFIVQQKQGMSFDFPKIDLKKKDENIVLLSLSNYQVSEKEKNQQEEKYSESTITPVEEIREEPLILKKEIQEAPTFEQEVLVQKEALLKEEKSIEKKIVEKRSTEEIIAQARSFLCKNKTSFTKTVTKTDFFRHAHAVAQQASMVLKEDLSARISGLGNLKLYSYEEKLRSTLLTAFNSLKHRIDRSVRAEQQQQHQAVQPHAAINLVINKDGSIDTLQLITSSGDQIFDKLIIESIEYAAPFPPIPEHLKIDKFRLGAMQLYVKY